MTKRILDPSSPQGQADLYHAAVMLLVDRLRPAEVADRLSREGQSLTRHQIYPLLADALDQGILLLVPPLDLELGRQLKDRLAPAFRDNIHVVDGPGDATAAVAAQVARDLIGGARAHSRDRAVGIGLGPGGATRAFCRHLSRFLQRDRVEDPQFEPVRLFSISAGCPATRPEFASTSFFDLFDESISQEPVGLFAPTVVDVDSHEDALSQPGAREVADRKGDIDIIFTALGGFDDHVHDYDILKQFLGDAIGKDWVGNVQYRPYTEKGPVREKSGKRAVTLFEIEDLVDRASRKHRDVLLLARSCKESGCDWTKARPLIPLLTVPKLKVWSHLFLDVPTAREVIRLLPKRG